MEDHHETTLPPPRIDPALLAQEPGKVAEAIEDIPRAQGAAVLQLLDTPRAAQVAEWLDPRTASEIIAELDHRPAAELIEAMQRPEAAVVLSEMDPDDRVDILGHIPPEAHDELVAELDAADAADVRQLESYASDTAGGIMTTEVTALYEYLTIDDAIQLLRKLNEELEQMYYVYVINRAGRLVGVLSMRDLILAQPSRRLRDIMIKNVRSVPADMDQEQVARIMRDKSYLAMPVTDSRGLLIGLITVDDVVRVLDSEATEDVQRLFGAGAEERLNSPWFFSFRQRFWWLLINLATAFAAGAVVGAFEGTIARVAILAAYMPIVAGMGGNASAQAMAVAVRGLSTGHVDGKLLRHVLKRELYVGLMTGVIIGLVTAGIAVVFNSGGRAMASNLTLGLVIGLAMLINHTLACTTGAGIPFLMKRLGFDPAQSATIFATTVTDVVGFFALLGLATLAMSRLVTT